MSEKCWNCGSDNYHNGISCESCDDCGIGCDYWGGGANDAYLSAMDSKHEEENSDDNYGDNFRGYTF